MLVKLNPLLIKGDVFLLFPLLLLNLLFVGSKNIRFSELCPFFGLLLEKVLISLLLLLLSLIKFFELLSLILTIS